MAFFLPSPPPPQHMVDAEKVVDTSWHEWFTRLWKAIYALYDMILAIQTTNTNITTGGFVPYFIPAGDTFIVPLYDQALFAMSIDVEGIIRVDGFLIQVD